MPTVHLPWVAEPRPHRTIVLQLVVVPAARRHLFTWSPWGTWHVCALDVWPHRTLLNDDNTPTPEPYSDDSGWESREASMENPAHLRPLERTRGSESSLVAFGVYASACS